MCCSCWNKNCCFVHLPTVLTRILIISTIQRCSDCSSHVVTLCANVSPGKLLLLGKVSPKILHTHFCLSYTLCLLSFRHERGSPRGIRHISSVDVRSNVWVQAQVENVLLIAVAQVVCESGSVPGLFSNALWVSTVEWSLWTGVILVPLDLVYTPVLTK